MNEGRIVSFTDLKAWQEAHKLRISVLKTIINFPQDYRFGLSAQLQRAAVSVGSNIAEGFGRQSLKEKLQFYNIACGSITEVQDQLLVCRDLQLIGTVKFKDLADQSITVHKLLRGLMRSVGARLPATSSKLPATIRSEADD